MQRPYAYRELNCATLFRYDERLGPREADPSDSVFVDSSDVWMPGRDDERRQQIGGTDQMQQADYDISVHKLAEMRTDGAAHAVLDIRESEELAVCAIGDSVTIPMRQVPDELETLPREHPLIVVCHHGMRSAMVTDFLRKNGFDDAWNLAGGIDAWSRHIEPDMPRY